MNNYPRPNPDRRVSQNRYNNNQHFPTSKIVSQNRSTNEETAGNQYSNAYFYNNNQNQTLNSGSKNDNDLFDSRSLSRSNHNVVCGNISVAKMKQVEEMRQKVLNCKLLTEKTMFFNPSEISSQVNKCNIILFGPSGSGKSSLIKTMYRALYNTPILSNEITKKLIIKNKYQNEGTLCFTQVELVPQNNHNSGIILCDTRGHFRMNEDEKEQFKILLGGKVKDGVQIKQRKERNPLELWEFWKNDSELFPKEIFKAEKPGINSVPHSVVFVFDGSTDEIIQKEDEFFYKQLVNISKNRGYANIHIVLTRIDVFEKNVNLMNKNLNEVEKSIKLNNLKDLKIEKVIETLGVQRSNVHFIENYHAENESCDNNMEIDYSILKTLLDIINASELYILWYMTQKESCLATCFGGDLL